MESWERGTMTDDEKLDRLIWEQDVKDAVKANTTREEYVSMHKPVYHNVAAKAWDRFSPSRV
jgi:hypothetical protein